MTSWALSRGVAFHLDSAEILLLVILGAPLAGLLADDEHPLVLVAVGQGSRWCRVPAGTSRLPTWSETGVMRVVAGFAPVRQT